MLTALNDLNDGAFNVGNFASVTEASALFKYINDSFYESKGFPPDIPIKYNEAHVAAGKDDVLEMAIQRLR